MNNDDVSDECEICDHLLKVCGVFDKETTCKDAIEEMKKGNISVGDLMDTIEKTFDKDQFKKEWDRLIDAKGTDLEKNHETDKGTDTG